MRIILSIAGLFFTIHLTGQDSLSLVQQYDFWIGSWEVSWDEGDGQRGTGTNQIVRILDEQVIQENDVELAD